jgi:methyl-accepting chemotaxis protein
MVGDCSHQMAGAAEEIAEASQTLAEGASEQASSLEQASSTLEEISSMAKSNAEGAVHATELLGRARTAADGGSSKMTEMSHAMDDIHTASGSIAKIIKTIDEIAFQTNILALNAAVEAARAGEAGLGFAVVADEVRNLAQRAAQAAKETAMLIEDSRNRSEFGVQLNQKVRSGLEEIVSIVRESADIGSNSAKAAQEESKGVEQVNVAIAQLDKLTQSNAATAEESASAAQQLNSLAMELRDAVVQLEIMVNGESRGMDQTGSVERKKPATHVETAAEKSRITLRLKG